MMAQQRLYDSDTGRFLAPDPIGLEGGMHRSRYVSNLPTGWIDPTGLAGWTETDEWEDAISSSQSVSLKGFNQVTAHLGEEAAALRTADMTEGFASFVPGDAEVSVLDVVKASLKDNYKGQGASIVSGSRARVAAKRTARRGAIAHFRKIREARRAHEELTQRTVEVRRTVSDESAAAEAIRMRLRPKSACDCTIGLSPTWKNTTGVTIGPGPNESPNLGPDLAAGVVTFTAWEVETIALALRVHPLGRDYAAPVMGVAADLHAAAGSVDGATGWSDVVAANLAFGNVPYEAVTVAAARRLVGGADDIVTLYHGTSVDNAALIRQGGIDLTAGSAHSDFGRGFYMSSTVEGALWSAGRRFKSEPLDVVTFHLRRSELGALRTKAFSAPDDAWGSFVRLHKAPPHGPLHGGNPYDLVTGPMFRRMSTSQGMLAWPGRVQNSIHTEAAVDLFNSGMLR